MSSRVTIILTPIMITSLTIMQKSANLSVARSSLVYVLASFLCAPLGGILCGVLCSWSAAFITKHTSSRK